VPGSVFVAPFWGYVLNNDGIAVIDNIGIESLMDAYSELVELWAAVDELGGVAEDLGVIDRSAVSKLTRLLAGYGITRARLERRREAQTRKGAWNGNARERVPV
jgi:hypothetical protein